MTEQMQPNPNTPETNESLTATEQLRVALEEIAPDAEYVPVPDSEYDPTDTSNHHILYPADDKGHTSRSNKITVISAAGRWNVIDQSSKGAQLYWVGKKDGSVTPMDNDPRLPALNVRFGEDKEALAGYLNELLERSTDEVPPSGLGKVLKHLTHRPQ